MKNNVVRILESKKVPFETFDLPKEKLGAKETARILGVPENIVYKSIVVLREKPGKPILAIIPGNHSVDLKALAKILGDKKVITATQKEAERLTRLQIGGISPLGLINRGFTMMLDENALNHPEIHISGGERGLNIRLMVNDLISITDAEVAAISSLMTGEVD